MINLDEVFGRADAAINESKKSDACELDRECVTLADVRDALREACADAVTIEPAEGCVKAYVTRRDGELMVAPGDPCECDAAPAKKAKAADWKVPKAQRACLDGSLKEIFEALDALGDDEAWGNGRSYLECVLAPPPDGMEKDYGGRFLAVFPEVLQFDAGMNRMDGTPDGADRILGAAKKCPCCAKADCACVDALKNAQECKKRLEGLQDRLEKMTDGLGWRCTLGQYVDDKYSRQIVNSAMRHGVDVSRDSQFVKSLSRRLAEIAARGKPTKSDLATYAKGDKVDFKSDACREFLADVEANSEKTNDEVLGPVRAFAADLAKAAKSLAQVVAALDRSGKAGKELKLDEGDGAPSRRTVECICKYCSGEPAGAVVGCNGRLYKVTPNFGGIAAVARLFNF